MSGSNREAAASRLRPRRAASIVLIYAVSVLVWPSITRAAHEPGHGEPSAEALGSSVDELLAIARRQNPEVAARALEADAAAARASGAGSLDDPMFRVTSDEVDRTSGSRINKMIYGIEQEFPLWGKRRLRRAVAEAETASARGRERGAVAELEARVKTAYARYWLASRSIAVEHDIHQLLHAIAQAAQARYAQGVGPQADAFRAETERTRLELELASLRRERSTSQARLNALLARPAGAALAEPAVVRPVPPADRLRLEDLVEQARQSSPAAASATADITGAEGGRKLIEKSWYPDVTVGAGAIDRANGPPGFMASVGLRIPLQWGLREAQAREATARSNAARARLDAALLDIRGGLDEALASLEQTRETEALLTNSLRPQTEAAYRSALTGYQLGRGDLTAALETAHRVQEVKVELLKVTAEQQTILAEIERLIGSDL